LAVAEEHLSLGVDTIIDGAARRVVGKDPQVIEKWSDIRKPRITYSAGVNGNYIARDQRDERFCRDRWKVKGAVAIRAIGGRHILLVRDRELIRER
jgi:hypothetical protein